jgi:DNA-binding protein HU-beta
MKEDDIVNKSQLIDQIAADADISKAAAGRALDSFIESVSGALKDGDCTCWFWYFLCT